MLQQFHPGRARRCALGHRARTRRQGAHQHFAGVLPAAGKSFVSVRRPWGA